MRNPIYIILILVVLILVGCFNVKENALIGTYTYSTDRADMVFVYKDHSYTHKYVNSKGKVYECKGKWKYRLGYISFDDFSFFNDAGQIGSGVWMSRVEEDDGKIKLIFSSDDDTYFGK